MILLDTDVCIEILRGNSKVIQRRKENDDHIAISFITVGELYYGAEKSKYKDKNLQLVEEFLLTVETLESDIYIMKKFSEIKSHLHQLNIMIPDFDIIIGAIALIKCDKLITGNTNHFQRIENLKLDNWIR